MGQYYRIFNMDKQQFISPDDFNNGMKLTEWSYLDEAIVIAMMNLMTSSWKKDHVFVIGDYADESDADQLWSQVYETFAKKFLESGGDNLYNFCSDHFVRLQPKDVNTIDPGYRYIYNHATKQVIDLCRCPVEWIWTERKIGTSFAKRFSPLPILLAMGNGNGGGDYAGNGTEEGKKSVLLAGSWCSTVSSIEISKQRVIDDCEGYEHLEQIFTENNPVRPNISEDWHIIQCDGCGAYYYSNEFSECPFCHKVA